MESGNWFPIDYLHPQTLWEEFMGSQFGNHLLGSLIELSVLLCPPSLRPLPLIYSSNVCTNQNVPELISFHSWGPEDHLPNKVAIFGFPYWNLSFTFSVFNFLFPIILPGNCLCLSNSSLVLSLDWKTTATAAVTKLVSKDHKQIVVRYYRSKIRMCAFSEEYFI